jgi:hypothetical protein
MYALATGSTAKDIPIRIMCTRFENWHRCGPSKNSFPKAFRRIGIIEAASRQNGSKGVAKCNIQDLCLPSRKRSGGSLVGLRWTFALLDWQRTEKGRGARQQTVDGQRHTLSDIEPNHLGYKCVERGNSKWETNTNDSCGTMWHSDQYPPWLFEWFPWKRRL